MEHIFQAYRTTIVKASDLIFIAAHCHNQNAVYGRVVGGFMPLVQVMPSQNSTVQQYLGYSLSVNIKWDVQERETRGIQLVPFLFMVRELSHQGFPVHSASPVDFGKTQSPCVKRKGQHQQKSTYTGARMIPCKMEHSVSTLEGRQQGDILGPFPKSYSFRWFSQDLYSAIEETCKNFL